MSDQSDPGTTGPLGGPRGTNQAVLFFVAVYVVVDLVLNGFRIPSGFIVGLAAVLAVDFLIKARRFAHSEGALTAVALLAGVAGPLATNLG